MFKKECVHCVGLNVFCEGIQRMRERKGRNRRIKGKRRDERPKKQFGYLIRVCVRWTGISELPCLYTPQCHLWERESKNWWGNYWLEAFPFFTKLEQSQNEPSCQNPTSRLMNENWSTLWPPTKEKTKPWPVCLTVAMSPHITLGLYGENNLI